MVGPSRRGHAAPAVCSAHLCPHRPPPPLPGSGSAGPLPQLVAPDGVLDRNFSLLGPGDTAVRAVAGCRQLLPSSMAAQVAIHRGCLCRQATGTCWQTLGLQSVMQQRLCMQQRGWRFFQESTHTYSLERTSQSTVLAACRPLSPRLQAGEVLLKDSMHCYKFWASGRRFCKASGPWPGWGAVADVAAAAAPHPIPTPTPTRIHTHLYPPSALLPVPPGRVCWPPSTWCVARTCWPLP